MKSISFDQAVGFYDKTRVDPAWVSRAITDSIIQLGRLTPTSRVMEVGIGTGRIALPLLQRNYQITGIDLSVSMMTELLKKTFGYATRIALAQSDANDLPFADATFDCVYAVHVYHLVANWQGALGQALRVLKPGGALLVSYHVRNPQSPNRKIRGKLYDLVQAYGVDAQRPGATTSDELKLELEKYGATRLVEIARWTEVTTVAQILDELEARYYSETWAIPENVMADVIAPLRAWARNEFGDLAREIPEESQFAWLMLKK